MEYYRVDEAKTCLKEFKTGGTEIQMFQNLQFQFPINVRLLPRFAVNQNLVQRDDNYALVDIKMYHPIKYSKLTK